MSQINILEWSDELITEDLNYAISQVRLHVSSDEDCLDYVVFSLEKLVSLIPLDEVENSLLSIVCPACAEVFMLTKSGLESLQSTDNLLSQINKSESGSHFLTVCCQILNSLQRACEHFLQYNGFKYAYIKALVPTISRIVTEAFALYRSCERMCSSMEFFLKEPPLELYKAACQLLTQLGHLINQAEFNLISDDEASDICIIMNDLMKTAMGLSELDPLLLIDTWKNVIIVMEKYQDFFRGNLDVCQVLKHLSLRILYQLDRFLLLENIVLKDAANDFKISNVYLKIAIRIGRIFVNYLSDNFSDVLDLLLALYTWTPSYLQGLGKSFEVISALTRHLVIGADPFLALLYTESSFPVFLKERIVEDVEFKPYGCIILLISLMKKLTTAKVRLEYFSSGVNILELVFLSLEACHVGMVMGTFRSPGSSATSEFHKGSDLYEYTYVSVAAFILSLTSKEFPLVEDFLLRNVLQVNPWRAMLAIDLWCLVARYANANICHSTIDTLIRVFKNVDLSSSRPELIYLSWLLNRLLSLCEPQFVTSFVERYPPVKCPWIWRIIGVRNSALLQPVPSFVDGYMKIVRDLISSSDYSTNLFQNMEMCLYSASSTPFQEGVFDSYWDILQKLWEIQPNGSTPWLDSYVGAISSVTAATISLLPPNVLLIILTRMAQLTNMQLASCQKLAILRILEKVSTVKIPANVAEAEIMNQLAATFRSVLKCDSVVLQTASLKAFANFAHVTQYPGVIEMTLANDSDLQMMFADFLRKKLPGHVVATSLTAPKYHHRCPENEPVVTEIMESVNWEKNPKRFKTDTGENDLQALNEAVNRFKLDSTIISENVAKLNSEQRNVVKSICANLQSI